MRSSADHIPLPTKEQAEAIVNPIKEPLRQAIKNAIDDWDSLYGGVRHILGARSQSNIIHDHIAHHAKELLASTPDVKTFKRKGIFTIAVESADIRIKKLDAKLRSNNVRTNQQTKYSLQLKLDGFSDLPRLTAGYVLDNLRIALEKAVVTLQVGRTVRYVVPLTEESGQSILPFTRPVEPPAAPRKRVRAKRTRQEEISE